VLPYLLIQAVIGFSLLEVVNYLEHYGLLRGKREDGRYERTRPSTAGTATASPRTCCSTTAAPLRPPRQPRCRRYQALRHFDEGPQLPTGYAGMIVTAAFPHCGGAVMDIACSISLWRGSGARELSNPRARKRVLARYGSPVAAKRGRRCGQRWCGRQWRGGTAVSRWRCPGCGLHLRRAGRATRARAFPAGTPWSEVPDEWVCPDCGVVRQARLRAGGHRRAA